MSDWKAKVDQREADLKARKAAEREAEYQRRELAKQREREKKLVELGRRFKCHECGRPSLRPATDADYHTYEEPVYTDNWDAPGDLTKCTVCCKWTCADDYYKGLCRSCANEGKMATKDSNGNLVRSRCGQRRFW